MGDSFHVGLQIERSFLLKIKQKIKDIELFKKNILLAGFLFFLFVFVGYLVVTMFPLAKKEITNALVQVLPDMDKYEASSFLSKFLYIYGRNIFATTIVLVSGLLTVGIVSLFSMLTNGFLVGVVIGLLSMKTDISPFKMFLVGILPHGVFELLALFLSSALGLSIANEVIKGAKREFFILKNIEGQSQEKYVHKQKKIGFLFIKIKKVNSVIKKCSNKGIRLGFYEFKTVSLLYLINIVPLLGIAAFIEVGITPILTNKFL